MGSNDTKNCSEMVQKLTKKVQPLFKESDYKDN